jgi:predicted nicotinamide N-methyase
VAWVGGQALARYTLDNPSLFHGLSVLDIGSGSGLCAIAAAKAGAATVEAYDIDPFSRNIVDINSRLNEVWIKSLHEDVVGTPSRWDVVLAGDVWYERFGAPPLTEWLRRIAGDGTAVIVGDCRRAHFPRCGLTELQQYDVPSPTSLERNAVTPTGVWRIQ